MPTLTGVSHMRSWMIGILPGILATAWLPVLPSAQMFVFVLLFACLVLLVRGPWGRFLLGGIVGIAIGCAHGQALLAARLPLHCVLEPVSLSGTVVSLPRRSVMRDDTPRQRFEFVIEEISPAACAGPRKLLLAYYGSQRLIPGERWHFSAKLKRPWGLANPGSFNMQSWYARTGIDALGNASERGARRLSRPRDYWASHHRLRLAISERIGQLGLPTETVAVLRALTVSDKSDLHYPLWSLLQRYGINHLLVISGLHIGLVALSVMFLGVLVRRAGQGLGVELAQIPALLVLIAAGGYTVLAGFSVATQRAMIMLSCFLLAGFFSRASSGGNNLLMAALLVLLLNPLAAIGSGFWLSFSAVAYLLWLGRWQLKAGRFRSAVATQLSMSLLMIPLGIWWFGGFSLVSALANLVLIPLVGFYVVPLALLATLAFVLGLPWDAHLWLAAAQPIEWLISLAQGSLLGKGAFVFIGAGPAELLLATIAVVLLATPLSWRTRALCVVLLAPLLLPKLHTQTGARLTVLDVGQGTSVVFRAGDRALLYDTGGGDPAGANLAQSVVLPFLRHEGIRHLDTLILSHPDADHSAGASSVLQGMQVERVRYGDKVPGVDRGRRCRAGEAWRWPGNIHFQFLSPGPGEHLSRNSGSCVLQIQLGSQRLMLPGDIERRRELELVRYWGAQLHSQTLLLAHHGSNTSSIHAWLKNVAPDHAVITSGYANRFGHPHGLVLERLLAQGAQALHISESGALEFDFSHQGRVTHSIYRAGLKPFWM